MVRRKRNTDQRCGVLDETARIAKRDSEMVKNKKNKLLILKRISLTLLIFTLGILASIFVNWGLSLLFASNYLLGMIIISGILFFMIYIVVVNTVK